MKKLLSILLITFTLSAAPSTVQYGKLLKLSVCEDGVNYQLIKESSLIQKVEKEFLLMNEEEFKTLSENDQIAWYNNLYNFYTVKLIVENMPVKSIRDLKSPWDSKIVPLFGKMISLNHLEHKILRKEYDEPRIHFSLNCASIGCPPLRPTPFTGDSLDIQLDEQAEGFLRDETRNRRENNTIYISQIFQWYGGDFKKKHGSYQNYIKEVLNISGKVKFKFLEYDWGLNSCD